MELPALSLTSFEPPELELGGVFIVTVGAISWVSSMIRFFLL
jgi:hypothetical protein